MSNGGRCGIRASALFAVALLACTMVAAAPTVTAAPYLQHQVDAGRTGSTLDPGPAEHVHQRIIDTALTVDVPGPRAYAAPPLVLDGAVFVLTGSPGPRVAPADGPAAHGIHRIDLGTGEVTTPVPLDDPPTAWASDGQSFFVATQAGIEAFGVDDGTHAWSWPFPGLGDAERRPVVCAPLAVHESMVYAACTRFAGEGGDDAAAVAVDTVVAAVTTTGEQAWAWVASERVVDPGGDPQDAADFVATVPAYEAKGLAVAGPIVAVALVEADRWETNPPTVTWTMALDRESGQRLWIDEETYAEYLGLTPAPVHLPAPGLLGMPNRLYVKGHVLEAYDTATGESLWARNLETLDPERGDLTGAVEWLGTAMGLHEGLLFVTSGPGVFALDAADGQVVWEQPNRPLGGADYEDGQGFLIAGDLAYVTNFNHILVGLEVDTAEIRVAQRLAEDPWPTYGYTDPDQAEDRAPPDRRLMIAIGEGVLSSVTWDGTVTVLGRTEASIQPRVEVSDPYPSPGEDVRVDMSGTTPGALDPGVEYQVRWGDGAVDGWQAEPSFNHTYIGAGETTALFQARNAAGQTASQSVVFDVGGEAPSEPHDPTLLEQAFARENQDLTFGVLGLLVAMTGGVIAVVRSRQKRGRLQRELEAIEAAYAASRHQPAECESALEERRAHVQGLALEGVLEEAQAALLERRIDDLGREVRLGALDDRYQFLPHGLVVRMRDMLADGRITAWEREHVLQALDQDAVLTKRQKAQVRDLVDEWFQRDAGSGA